jgi:hypothetical protein
MGRYRKFDRDFQQGAVRLGVVVDVGPFLLQLQQPPVPGADHLPDGGRCFRDEDQEHPGPDVGVLGEVLLGDQVFAFTPTTVDHRIRCAFAEARKRRESW